MAKRAYTKREMVVETFETKLAHFRAMKEIHLFSAPTRFFAPGEEVSWGGWDNVKIISVHDDGLFYYLSHESSKKKEGEEVKTNYSFVAWHDVFPKNELCTAPSFRVEENFWLRFSNSSINSLYSYFYCFGITGDVDYQRDLVWTEEQKVALIDSIFNNVDIGKFVFIYRGDSYEGDERYEILDGKQRINTIREFTEGKFKYKGYTFAELSKQDRTHFEGHGISYASAERMTEAQKLRYFIKLNTTGTPMDVKHLENVKNKLAMMEAK